MQAETRLTSLIKLCLRFLQAPAQRKVVNSSWMLKTVQSYIRPGRVFFFSFIFFFMFMYMQLTKPCVHALHLQSAHVSYAGDRPCKHQRCSLLHRRMHVTGGSFAFRVSQTIETYGRKLVLSIHPRKGRLLLRKNRAVIVSFSSLHHKCGTRSGWKQSAVAPCMHVTGESFAIRVSYAIEPKRKGRMSALDPSAFFRDVAT